MNAKRKKPTKELVRKYGSVEVHLALLAQRSSRDQVRALALLAGAREVLRALVRLAPVPPPKEPKCGLELLPVELVQAAADLLIPLNDFLKEAQR